jgi:TolB-like protein
MAEPLPSADKPSIAVLPLENMSGDPEQEYFVDGICEDIITALSRIRQFFVIARNSTFQYKGTSPDIRDVANNLGVRYVLEGSVRKAGDQLRITAQLIDGDTGNHIWAERYDRKLEDIFAVQDEITQTVVGAIEPELGRAEYERMKAKPPGNLNAWEAFHRGMILVSRKSKDGNVEARKLFRQSIELDAGFAPAHAAVAWSLAQDIYFQHFDHDPDECLGIARRAVELDDKDPFSHFALGWALTYVKQPQDAIDSMRKAIAINPSYAHAHAILGRLLAHTGKAEEALRQVEIASTFSPADPNKGLWLNVVAVSNLYLGKHEDAIRWAKACTQTVDNWPPWMVVVSAAGHLGDAKQIEEARNELRARQPAISIDYVRDN